MTPEQREAKRALNAAYYADHRGEKSARDVTYRAAHGEERCAYRVAHRDEAREKAAVLCAEFHEWLQILRTNNGCEDCETHEGRLLHHHVDPTTKLYNVSDMYGRSLDVLEDEMEKCTVLCDSCHTKRHVEMRAA